MRRLRCYRRPWFYEPDSPLLHAWLGRCYSVIYQSGWSQSPRETRQLGLDSCTRALRDAASDLRILQAYGAAMGSFGTDLAATDSMLDRGLARDPEKSRLLLAAAWIKALVGRKSDLALAASQAFLDRDPNSRAVPSAILCQAICHFQLKAFDAAIPLVKEVCALRPGHMFAQAILTASLAQSGRLDEARAAWANLKAKAQIEIILAMLRDPDDRELLRSGLVMAGMEG